jgi:hypothetical protein
MLLGGLAGFSWSRMGSSDTAFVQDTTVNTLTWIGTRILQRDLCPGSAQLRCDHLRRPPGHIVGKIGTSIHEQLRHAKHRTSFKVVVQGFNSAAYLVRFRTVFPGPMHRVQTGDGSPTADSQF